jgi:large-conductance mechanosensitive channel
MNKMKDRMSKKDVVDATPADELLLAEIRDLLKSQQGRD